MKNLAFKNLEKEKEGAYSNKEYSSQLVKLLPYNIGGVPLFCLAGSSWFAPGNCKLLADWFSVVVPEGNYIEGYTETYLKLAEDGPHKKWKGYHVWIEFFDPDSLTEKVLDPVTFSVLDKKYFYENEKAVALTSTPCYEISDELIIRPNKDYELDENDMYRLACLFSCVKPLVDADFGPYTDLINEFTKKIIKVNQLEKLKNEIKEVAKAEGKDFGEIANELFTFKDKFDGKKFDEQNFILDYLVDKFQNIKDMGSMDEEGKIIIPEEIINVRKRD